MEFSVFNESDAIEVAWTGITKDALNKYPKLDKSKFHHIPNGFDSEDYPKMNQLKNEKFTITYTGSMYGRRNPQSFLLALKNLIQKDIIKPEQITIRFIGRFGSEVETMFKEFPHQACLEIIPYLPHSKSIAYLIQSDTLLLIVDESKESEEIVPGKVYEYLGTKKPIIAIAPQESSISNLLNDCGIGYIAHQSEIEKTEQIIKTLYIYWKSDFKGFNPNLQKINKYERKHLAKELSNLFNSLSL
jgi:glycosyltransferase involved in cell wall biosynthesis